MSRTRGVLRACLAASLLALSGHAAGAEQVHLTWFMWSGTEPEVVAWKHVAELVTQKYPDITVEFQTTSFPDYWTKLPALAAAGKLPDIVSLQSLRAPGFADLMVPLDDRIKADKFDIDAFDPSIIKGLSRNGKQFALPYDFGPLVLYYNHDMFAKAGVAAAGAGLDRGGFHARRQGADQGRHVRLCRQRARCLHGVRPLEGRALSRRQGQLDLTNPGMKSAFTQYAALVSQDKVAPLLPASGVQSSSDRQRPLHRRQCRDVRRWALATSQHQEEGQLHRGHGPGAGARGRQHHAQCRLRLRHFDHQQAQGRRLEGDPGDDRAGCREIPCRGRPRVRRAQRLPKVLVRRRRGRRGRCARGAARSAEDRRPYVTTPNWATVAALFEQYAPLAFGGSEQPGKVLDTIQNLALPSSRVWPRRTPGAAAGAPTCAPRSPSCCPASSA